MKLADIISQNKVVTLAQLLQDPELIRDIQSALALKGWYPEKKVDGYWGALTQGAIFNFCLVEHLNNHTSGKFGAAFAIKLKEQKRLPVTKDDHQKLIIAECRRQGINQINQIAYVLATVQHETDGKYQPIEEYASGMQYEGNHDLGNIERGDGMRYKGRGYVQLTGRINYERYSKLTGKNLIFAPKLAQEPYTAAFILCHGFRTGGFTGRRLGDYVANSSCDFINARRCINGLDKASLIASYAKNWVGKLDEGI